jgi:hypothetical protein
MTPDNILSYEGGANCMSKYIAKVSIGVPIPCPIISPCDFTLTFWYKTGGISTSVSILGQYSAPETNVLYWSSASSQLVLYVGGVSVVLTTLKNNNLWHFVKFSYTAITHTALVSEDNETDVSTITILPDSFLKSAMTILANTSTGELFDVRLFSAVLSNADLTYYYNDILVGGNRTLSQA